VHGGTTSVESGRPPGPAGQGGGGACICAAFGWTRRNIPTMERLWCSSRRHLPWLAACTHACVVRSGARGLCKHATRAANNSPDWALEHGTQRARSPYVPIAPAGLYSSQHDPCHVVFLSRQDQPVHGRIRGRRQRCTCTHPTTFIQFFAKLSTISPPSPSWPPCS